MTLAGDTREAADRARVLYAVIVEEPSRQTGRARATEGVANGSVAGDPVGCRWHWRGCGCGCWRRCGCGGWRGCGRWARIRRRRRHRGCWRGRWCWARIRRCRRHRRGQAASVALTAVSPYLRGCLQAPMNRRRQFHDARVFDSAMNELTLQLGCEVVVEAPQANEPRELAIRLGCRLYAARRCHDERRPCTPCDPWQPVSLMQATNTA